MIGIFVDESLYKGCSMADNKLKLYYYIIKLYESKDFVKIH